MGLSYLLFIIILFKIYYTYDYVSLRLIIRRHDQVLSLACPDKKPTRAVEGWACHFDNHKGIKRQKLYCEMKFLHRKPYYGFNLQTWILHCRHIWYRVWHYMRYHAILDFQKVPSALWFIFTFQCVLFIVKRLHKISFTDI